MVLILKSPSCRNTGRSERIGRWFLENYRVIKMDVTKMTRAALADQAGWEQKKLIARRICLFSDFSIGCTTVRWNTQRNSSMKNLAKAGNPESKS